MEKEKLRVGVCGLSHDHVWGNLDELLRTGRADIVMAYDESEHCRQRLQSMCPEASIATTPEETYTTRDVEALFIFGDNRQSGEWAAAALREGVPCLIEKPMAASSEAAENMLRASHESGAALMINWPFYWWPPLQEALRRIARGDLGRVHKVHYRAGHRGPKNVGCSDAFVDWLYDSKRNGGAALMDYCCYGAALAGAILGQPDSTQGHAFRSGLIPDLDGEDNAVLTMRYESAVAIAEASWTQQDEMTAYRASFYGEHGTLVAEPYHDGRLFLASASDPHGTQQSIHQPGNGFGTASEHFLRVIEDESFSVHPLLSGEVGLIAQIALSDAIRNQTVCGEYGQV